MPWGIDISLALSSCLSVTSSSQPSLPGFLGIQLMHSRCIYTRIKRTWRRLPTMPFFRPLLVLPSKVLRHYVRVLLVCLVSVQGKKTSSLLYVSVGLIGERGGVFGRR